MSPRVIRHRLALVGTGGLLAAAALSQCAPPANATPMGYLQALNDRGITVTDTTQALTMGYAVCAALNSNTGDVVAESPEMAVAVVVTAVEQLCPWHDHRGQVA